MTPSPVSDIPPCSAGGVAGGCASGTVGNGLDFRGRPRPRLTGGTINADAANAASLADKVSERGRECACVGGGAKEGARVGGGAKEGARVGGGAKEGARVGGGAREGARCGAMASPGGSRPLKLYR